MSPPPHDTAPRTVLAGRRTIGYRRFGDGPPIVLLHASPRSSAALLPLGLRLAERFTVFALDSPGFGWSDPLPLTRPDAQDYAAALIEAFGALGLGRVPIYGSHTGAAIAVAAAAAYPKRVACLALDGYAIFSPEEQAEFLASYLAPITPHWDGTHLAWLWSRVKDQFTVFPWYWRAQQARLPRPLVPLHLLQAVVLDFLAAGDNYRHALRRGLPLRSSGRTAPGARAGGRHGALRRPAVSLPGSAHRPACLCHGAPAWHR